MTQTLANVIRDMVLAVILFYNILLTYVRTPKLKITVGITTIAFVATTATTAASATAAAII